MRREIRLCALAFAPTGCEQTATTPPGVYGPAAGATVGRCLVRVRMDEPQGYDTAARGFSHREGPTARPEVRYK